MLIELLGSVTLNVSLCLYCIVYWPQLMHNKKSSNLLQLNLRLHALLYLSYALDLFYGFAMNLSWQYRFVSVLSMSYVLLQHVQLIGLYWRINRKLVLGKCLVLVAHLWIIFLFFVTMQMHLSSTLAFWISLVSRMCGLIYGIPQILQQKKLLLAQAINPMFINVSLCLSVLDTTSAWCLNWGWPNKLASILVIAMMCILKYQAHAYG